MTSGKFISRSIEIFYAHELDAKNVFKIHGKILEVPLCNLCYHTQKKELNNRLEQFSFTIEQ